MLQYCRLLSPFHTFYILLQVNWKPSTVSFSRRFDKYLDTSFFQHRVRKREGGERERRKWNQFLLNKLLLSISDSLVLNIQLVHDGNISGGTGLHDNVAYTQEGLCTLLQRRRFE